MRTLAALREVNLQGYGGERGCCEIAVAYWLNFSDVCF
jgi:hypothetical protein